MDSLGRFPLKIMINRLVKLIAIPFVIVIITATTIFAAEAQRTPEWQILLKQYAANHNLAVVDSVRAGQPYNFTGELDYPLVLPSTFEYTADITYQQSDAYMIALPYPPEQVRCALMEQSGKRMLLFINYYSDGLWQNGWVIHQGPALFSTAATQSLDRLGCDLPLNSL